MSALARPSIGLTRRQVLAGGGAAATAAVLGQWLLSTPPTSLQRLVGDAGPILSVGFVDRIIDDVTELVGAGVVPATSLGPDGGAEMWQAEVLGGTPGLVDTLADRSLALEVLYDSATDDPYPFLAWSHTPGPIANEASAVTFDVPAAPFGVGVRMTVGDTATAPTAVLATANRDGIPALRPGTYLLGVGTDTWDRGATLPASTDAAAWRTRGSLVLGMSPA